MTDIRMLSHTASCLAKIPCYKHEITDYFCPEQYAFPDVRDPPVFRGGFGGGGGGGDKEGGPNGIGSTGAGFRASVRTVPRFESTTDAPVRLGRSRLLICRAF